MKLSRIQAAKNQGAKDHDRTAIRNSRQLRKESESNIDNIFDFLDNESTYVQSRKLSSEIHAVSK